MKMRKILALVMALAMMLVCLPVQANAEEQRASLMPKKFEPLETISVTEEGVIVFSGMEDLKQILTDAQDNPDYEYLCFYFGSSDLTVDANMWIPGNVVISMNSNKITVNTGKQLIVDGVLEVGKLDVNGSLLVSDAGIVSVSSILSIITSGIVELRGTLYLNGGLGVKVVGKERIVYGKNALAICSGVFSSEDDLQKIFDAAAANDHPNWLYYFSGGGEVCVTKDMTIPKNCVIETVDMGLLSTIPYGTSITVYGALVAYDPADIDCYLNIMPGGTLSVGAWVNAGGKITNLGTIEIATGFGGYTGRLYFPFRQYYVDAENGMSGKIMVMAPTEMGYPENALEGLSVDDFTVEWEQSDGISCWTLTGFSCDHLDALVVLPAIAPTCLDYGCTEGAHCTKCGEDVHFQEVLAPLGHDYGLAEDGNPDFWDTTCDVCGAERKVDKHRPTHSMYRMYNPNSGEHFYTGSMEERKVLEAAGWKYEGVGFTFPATTGKPVYRLYDKNNTFEHLYTMDEAEKDKLLAEGWVLEGIAFNSGREDEVPQYRLHNPNATIGAYHFTASREEKDALIAAGWEYQGIGFYTCLQ